MKLRVILIVSVMVGTLLGVTAWRMSDASPVENPTVSGPTSPEPETIVGAPEIAPSPTISTSIPSRVAYVVSRHGTTLHISPDETGAPIAGGVVFPVLSELSDGYRILDTCNTEGWVRASDMEEGLVTEAPANGEFDRSVFVIDPGHGLPDLGAVGPTGLTETEVNLDVAARVVELLRTPHEIDWSTGSLRPGDTVPAAATAILTRSPDGPNGGDYQLGLTFRATVANAVGATAFVSIHHNTSPETMLDHPGSEAFVSLSNPESPRLGGLIVEELRTSFARFGSDWAGSSGTGLISRVDPDGSDYYTLLNRAEVPAVIVEGAYISNPAEEALARTDDFRQAYAEAIYRALVRFVTTEDDPIPHPEPTIWDVDIPGPSMSGCEVPTPESP